MPAQKGLERKQNRTLIIDDKNSMVICHGCEVSSAGAFIPPTIAYYDGNAPALSTPRTRYRQCNSRDESRGCGIIHSAEFSAVNFHNNPHPI